MTDDPALADIRDNPRLHGVDPTSRRDVWMKKLLYPAHTIPTAGAPVLVGLGFAVGDDVFAALPALAVFVFGWMVQVGGVLADNYYNLKRYRDDAEHPALVYALDHDVVSLAEIRRAFVVTFLAAAFVGGYLLVRGGLPVLFVGASAIAASILYSLEITDIPLHDLYFFFFFGPVSVGGTYYLQAVWTSVGGFPTWVPPGTLPLPVVLAGVPIGALTANILVVDNVRDLDFDLEKDDTTLAVVIGERFSRRQYDALLAVAYLWPIVLWVAFDVAPSVLLTLLSVPLAVHVARQFHVARTYVELYPVSPRSGQVLVAYAALLALGAAASLGSA
ncbi:MAG: UbiA family prenyltransferase [Halanaeroarchaeum sp.]